MFVRVSGMALSIAAGSLVVASDVSAQSLAAVPAASVNMFTRSRNVSVQDRPQPAYEAFGIRAGSFLVYPRLEIGSEFNDNVYATAADRSDDLILHLRPEISLESNWNQNFVTAYVRAALNRYSDFTSENTNEFNAGFAGRLDVSRLSNLASGLTYLSTFEPRTSPNSPSSTVSPIRLDVTQTYLSASRAGGRIKLSGRGDWRSYNYHDGRTLTHALVEQDTRDRRVVSVLGRVDYAFSPDTAVFAQATGNDRNYDIASTPALPNRDSSGQEYLLGVSFEAGSVARGEISAGYIHQDFDEPAYRDVSGLGGRAQLEWFATNLTTVTLTAGRTVEDVANFGTGGYLSSSIGVTVDHELLRNVILTTALTYAVDDYKGADRKDTRVSGSLSATYLINRHLGVSASLATADTGSKGLNAASDFRVNRLSIALVGQF